MKNRGVGRLLPALLAAPAIVILAVAGCIGRRQQGTPVVSARETQSQYVGNDACARCHMDECRGYGETNHARTFRRMTPSELGAQAPLLGPLPHTKCVLELANGRYDVTVPGAGVRKTLDYALGSGKTGITYIAIDNNTSLTEMRMSYFPSRREWFITPGQESTGKDSAEIGRNQGNKRACILCHAVAIPPDSLHPDQKLMGVGCEACHGAGAAHIAALNQGKSGPPMKRLAEANGDRINALCGTCHRSIEDIFAMPSPNQSTARFPVFGLASSRCYQASGGKLTCITCHDPHENARTAAAYYEAKCLSCHSQNASEPGTQIAGKELRPIFRGSVRGKVCRVNALSGCIQCHMPQRKVFGVTTVPTTMADHLIKVYGKAGPSKRRE